jgi:hypothetical protein
MTSFRILILFAAMAHGPTLAADPQPLSLARAVAAAGAAAGPARAPAARVEATQQFYDALVADREYAAANEQVAVTYVAFDRARARAGAAAATDIPVKELEVYYARALERRHGVLARQRLARHALAGTMGVAAMPRELEEPEAPPATGTIPDVDELEKAMAARAAPNRTAADVARDRAELLRTTLDIERLRRAVLPRAEREAELADMKLEMARDDHDRGRPAALGAAMAGTAEAAWRRLQARGELAVALARLEALAGPTLP